jgi:uncharacterized membrane protein/protein-disulfide isomerase
MKAPRRTWPWWRWVLTGLSGLGLALSAYLSGHYLMGGSVIGCGGGSPCDTVLNSRWSEVGGVLPVTGLAAGAYLAMLVASLFLGPATAAPDRRLAWGALLILAGTAAGSAVWFTIVQKWVIGAFCPYCMATHITGLLLAALVIWRAPLQFDDDSTAAGLTNPAPAGDVGAVSPSSQPSAGVPALAGVPPKGGTPAPAAPNAAAGAGLGDAVEDASPAAPRRVIGRWPAIGLALAGVALAGILAACQIGLAPSPVYRGGEWQGNRLPAIVPRAVPLVGSPDAQYVVTLFFDYKCRHCQQLHSMLDEATDRYGGKLAFVLCPAPLTSQCNPYVPRDLDEFKDSCELAKIGLAVWVAKREAFPVFDRWMFSPESGQLWQPRSPDAARAKAVELVGQAEFDAARADPWIDRYMQTSIRIYGDSIHLDPSSSAIPKLVFGSRWVTPEPEGADDLIVILHASLAVPRP